MPRRVLLLTANQDFADSMSELLALHGFDVATIEGPAAVQAVIADLDQWPGDWNLRLLRQRHGHLPCLLLSGSPFAGPYTATTLAHGYFMPKPFESERLLVLLRRCVDQGSLGC